MGKIVNIVLGILLIAAGLIPLLQDQGIELPLPENVLIYQIATIVIGILVLFFTLRRRYVKVKR